MTIGFARRAATYKRADLIFHKHDRLKWIARKAGRLQIIFGGKARPHDERGKELIRKIAEHAWELKDAMKVIYLEDFDWQWAPLLYSGVHLWLNTPKWPQEASGMRDEGRDESSSQPQHSGRLMRGATAVNGSFFNTHCMVSQYLANAWFREDAAERRSGPL